MGKREIEREREASNETIKMQMKGIKKHKEWRKLMEEKGNELWSLPRGGGMVLAGGWM